MSKTLVSIAFAAAGIAVIVTLLYYALAPVDVPRTRAETRAERQKSRQISDARETKSSKLIKEPTAGSGKPARAARPKNFMKMPEDWFAKLSSSKDRAIAKAIQDAQDADDREAVFKAAEEALSSKSAEVRQAAVEALSLQGEAAIQPLLNYVADPNKDVAESAFHAWDDAVDSVEGDIAKLGAVKDVLQRVKDEEQVKSAVGKIESFDAPRAIRELAKLAKEDGKASKAARESYEQVTGEPFESWEAAELKALVLSREADQDDGGAEEP